MGRTARGRTSATSVRAAEPVRLPGLRTRGLAPLSGSRAGFRAEPATEGGSNLSRFDDGGGQEKNRHLLRWEEYRERIGEDEKQ